MQRPGEHVRPPLVADISKHKAGGASKQQERGAPPHPRHHPSPHTAAGDPNPGPISVRLDCACPSGKKKSKESDLRVMARPAHLSPSPAPR